MDLRKGTDTTPDVDQREGARSFIPTPGGYLIDSQDWGWTVVPQDIVDDLTSFTGRTNGEILERLSRYSSREMGAAWSAASPRTPEKMRRFYSTMDLYLWDLAIWHASLAYKPYLDSLDHLASILGPGRTALDYGAGIGTAALRLAEHGYQMTIADVPGVTFEFAQHRLRRRGLPFTAVPIAEDHPKFSGRYDAIVCFDVLEHVPHPERVFRHFAQVLAPGGIANVVASFDAQSEHAAYHLRENYVRWGRGRWPLFISGCGFYDVGGGLYARDTSLRRLARAAQYGLWRLTGLDVRYKSRRIHG